MPAASFPRTAAPAAGSESRGSATSSCKAYKSAPSAGADGESGERQTKKFFQSVRIDSTIGLLALETRRAAPMKRGEDE